MEPKIGRRSNDWIQTYTGRQFFPLNPYADEVHLEDIAHALSMICRYTGHCLRFYSVAQHCVIMAENAPPNRRREVLMHDAAEAYMADVARPIKPSMPELKPIETRLEQCIAYRFDLVYPWPEIVKELDLRALATEQRDLMRQPPIPWRSTEGVTPFERTITPVDPSAAKSMFLAYAESCGIR